MGCIGSKREISGHLAATKQIKEATLQDKSTIEEKTNISEKGNSRQLKRIFVQKPMRKGNEKYSRPSDLSVESKITLLRTLSGEPGIFNPNKDIKQQEKVIPYNSKREIDRSNFTIEEMIGSGNFGSVYKGILTGLYDTNNKIPVAIKTLSSFESRREFAAFEGFIGEIKIMSNVDPHLNLVNMIGSCTSDFAETNQLWLLLEYCQFGDLKSYLISNKSEILNGKESESINSRLLIQWCYDIAKGMQFLARCNVMHGDLAARNILLEDELIHSRRIVAKISDFGLSKHMYEEVKYEKKSRLDVPWKWMAIEYLEFGFFTLTSDVWSFAILVWEILSFGGMPYGFESYDEILEKLQSGYRLPCPSEASNIETWSPCQLYEKLAKICYVKDFADRASFTTVIECIESELTKNEITLHGKISDTYLQIRASNYINRKRLITV